MELDAATYTTWKTAERQDGSTVSAEFQEFVDFQIMSGSVKAGMPKTVAIGVRSQVPSSSPTSRTAAAPSSSNLPNLSSVRGTGCIAPEKGGRSRMRIITPRENRAQIQVPGHQTPRDRSPSPGGDERERSRSPDDGTCDICGAQGARVECNECQATAICFDCVTQKTEWNCSLCVQLTK